MAMKMQMSMLMLPTVTEVSSDKVFAKYFSMHCVSSIEMSCHTLWSAHAHFSVVGCWCTLYTESVLHV